MPLFSEHISNMYYSGTPSYSSVPHTYSGSPYGTSYSASYLNPGGNYSNHSSLGPYTRTLSSRWLGRNYSPMLSTITEKGTTSPVRINSPRRTPVSRTYASHISIPTTSYTARPININTADIDVSRDKYRNKSNVAQRISTGSPRWSPSSRKNKELTSEVGEKSNMGVDSSPESPPKRSTIKRDRPVVRLHTIKRKERDSPRQLVQSSLEENSRNQNIVEDSTKSKLKWRERLADDLAYKNKKEKKTIGEMLVEKFTLKGKDDGDLENITIEIPDESSKELDVGTSLEDITIDKHKLTSRRCSMEQLAEQASLLDSLIRRENLSTAILDLSKIGGEIDKKYQEDLEQRKRKFVDQPNPLKTTKSEHCLPTKPTAKRKSLRKSMSGENIRKLDRISEIPQMHNQNLPCDETKTSSIKRNSKIIKGKPKLKQKITASVEVSTPPSPLKFVVENVTVEEKTLNKKKDIVYTSSIDDSNKLDDLKKLPTQVIVSGHRKSVKRKIKPKVQLSSSEVISPEPEDGNFWDKIGKRETVYLIQRKKELDKASEQNKRSIFWFPGEEEVELNKDKETSNEIKSDNETSTVTDVLKSAQTVDIKSNEIKEQLKTLKSLKESTLIVLRNNEKTKGIETIDNIDELNLNKESNISQYEKKNVTVHQEKGNSPSEVSNIPPIDSKPRELNLQKSDPKATVPEAPLHATLENTQTGTENITNNSPCENITNKFGEEKLDTSNISINNFTKVVSKQEEIPAITSLGIEFTKSEYTLEDHKDITSLTKQNCEKSCDTITDNGQPICDKTQPEINDCDADNKSHVKGDKKEYEEFQINKENNTEVKLDLDIPSVAKRSSVNIKSKDIKTEFEESKLLKQASVKEPVLNVDVNQLFANRKPVKDVPAPRPLIATPRPLQKKAAPQILHSSSSSETSSSEESSSEEEEDETSESSSDSCVCENNVDGRTSTGSNDSGFDSSAPASPSGFSYVRKDCDVNCHRKCEKLTANLCGVNQRLLVEALALRTASKRGAEPSTSGSAVSHDDAHDILQQEPEQSTAYDLFKKTGRFTPPARSIPRFRKYTIDDFHFIKVLGKGSFGKVMLAELRDTEYYYAVKCLKKDVVLEDDDVECTLIERKVLALGTNHPYLCHLFATFQTDSHLFFVMEYLNGGDLMFHIQLSGRFPEPRARFYAAEIVSGLKFLHKRGIVYRDLKLDNILLDFEGHVRIADFGMCKLQMYLDKTADTFCGTPDYMAPEIIKGLKYNQTVDWWSFGVLLYEMLIGQSPFSGCDEDELFWSICNEMPSYPRFLSADSLAILTRLMDKDARTRLGGAECVHGDIRDQPFFHDVPWDRLERRDLPAPFKPRVRHPLDTQYFDRAFTGERPRLTAVEPHVLRSMDQGPFRGFSYTNPNATDR